MLRVSEQAHRTDTGRQRTANEDAYFARAPVFVVADGMGGAQAGEVASRIAADAFESGNEHDEPPEAYLRGIASEANRRIHELALEDASRSGMGTTLTAAMVHEDELSLAHVGDSRAYLYRDGELRQLTNDHSLVEELRRQGRLTDAQAEDHPQRSIITRALGPEPRVEVDTMTYWLRSDDVVLLCSDGLTTMLPEERIAAILERSGDLRSAAARMIREANEGGGRDNITVVAFRLAEIGEPQAPEEATLVGPTAADAGLETGITRERPAAAAPPAPRRRAWPRRLGIALAALVVCAALIVAGILGLRQIWFLGTDEGGRIALFRGAPYELPFGIDLYEERYSSPVQAADVPADRRESLTNHELRSRADAVDLLRDLELAVIRAGRPSTDRGRDGKGGDRSAETGDGQRGRSGQGQGGP